MTVKIRLKLLPADHGRDIHIPEAIVLSGDEAIVHSESGRPTVDPIASSSLLTALSHLQAVEAMWPEIEDRPPEPVEL